MTGAGIVAVAIVLMGYGTSLQDQQLGSIVDEPTIETASSTAFTLTTASQRLLATSSLRVAATISPRNCGTDSQVFLKAQNDVVAVANSGPMVFATTTLSLGTLPQVPVLTGAVQGITNTGTCTVIVTEWRRPI